ncbi:MAG: cytochrome c3 family protein [Desulfuromonadaceae bacterium]
MNYLRDRLLFNWRTTAFSLALVLLWGTSVCSAQGAEPTKQEQAQTRAAERVPQIKEVKHEDPLRRSQRLRHMGISVKDVRQTYFVLDSPIIKEREDHYTPVRFNHGQHAASVDDCTVCHHKRPVEDVSFSPNPELVRCSACHQQSFDPEFPERLGLKAAYHQRCIGCHEEEDRGPQVCADCHLEQVPEHKELVELPENPDPLEVTAECLRCHAEEAEHFKHTAHWRWRGHSEYTAEHARAVEHGKGTTALNNY